MEHPRYVSGRLQATPNCPCDHCRAVFNEWGAQALGFQQWYDNMTREQHTRYFGPWDN